VSIELQSNEREFKNQLDLLTRLRLDITSSSYRDKSKYFFISMLPFTISDVVEVNLTNKMYENQKYVSSVVQSTVCTLPYRMGRTSLM